MSARERGCLRVGWSSRRAGGVAKAPPRRKHSRVAANRCGARRPSAARAGPISGTSDSSARVARRARDCGCKVASTTRVRRRGARAQVRRTKGAEARARAGRSRLESAHAQPHSGRRAAQGQTVNHRRRGVEDARWKRFSAKTSELAGDDGGEGSGRFRERTCKRRRIALWHGRVGGPCGARALPVASHRCCGRRWRRGRLRLPCGSRVGELSRAASEGGP